MVNQWELHELLSRKAGGLTSVELSALTGDTRSGLSFKLRKLAEGGFVRREVLLRPSGWMRPGYKYHALPIKTGLRASGGPRLKSRQELR
jgi:predicted transcriptional regulator